MPSWVTQLGEMTVDDLRLVVAAAAVVGITMFLWRRHRKPLPPGPTRWPGLGNLAQLKGDEMFYVKLDKFRPTYGDLVYLTLGSMKVLVVYGHDQVHRVLTKKAEDFHFRPSWLVEIQNMALFNGIVWSDPPKTEIRRHFAMPSVCPGVGKMTVEGRVQLEGRAVIEEIRKHGDEQLPLRDIFNQATFNIICSVVFGSRFEYTDADFKELKSIMTQLLQSKGISNPKNFFSILKLMPKNHEARETEAVFQRFKDFIHVRIENAKKSFDADNVAGLIDLYIQRSQSKRETDTVSEENVANIIRDLFVAGTDNSAIGLYWLIAYMIRYPDVQSKCRAQIRQLGLAADARFSMADEDRLPYVQATVNEVLRLANIAPLSVPHATVADVEYEGFRLPKNTMVLTHLVSVHLDPKYWDNPEVFNPQRFLADGKVVTKEAFYPFSVGPRVCLAENLARMELFLIFSELLRNFEFKSPDGSKPPSLKQMQPRAFVEPEPYDVCVTAL